MPWTHPQASEEECIAAMYVANVVDDFEVLVIDCGSASVFFLETSEGTGCTAASLSEHKWSLRKFQAV